MKRLALMPLILLCALPAAAAGPRILASQEAWPVWSPDGRTIAFTRVRTPRNLMELMVVDLATGRVTKLAQNSFQLQPSWSRDSRSLAYQAGDSVYITDLQGRKHRIGPGGSPVLGPANAVARVIDELLYVGSSPLTGSVLGHPAWSPDGFFLAFRRADGIYTMDSGKPGSDRLLVGGANPGDPAWSPDGSQVAFTLGDEIWVASRGLVPAHAIAAAKPGAFTPAWAPAGDAVVYTWRGGLERTTLTGKSTLLHQPAGLGASVSGDGTVAYPGPRPGCPGHLAIVTSSPLTGSCDVVGSAAADVIEGTALWGDVILAGAGNDQIHANDRHTDRVNCGPGRDTVWADRTDRLTGCEVIHH
jgi:dipeptidyl aminopeptidase/acylaminoacyl peptidase